MRLMVNPFYPESCITEYTQYTMITPHAVSQARADTGKANWVTLELRHDRVHQTFMRSVFAKVHFSLMLESLSKNISQHYIIVSLKKLRERISLIQDVLNGLMIGDWMRHDRVHQTFMRSVFAKVPLTPPLQGFLTNKRTHLPRTLPWA